MGESDGATKDLLRQKVLELVNAGMSQKVLAAKLHLSESKLSRWLGEDHADVVIPLETLDYWNAYRREVIKLFEEPQRDAAEDTFRRRADTSGDPGRKTGT